MILAAAQYACRLVVPSSKQHPPIRWSSHKDHARKALAKLVGPHLPASLTQLEKAVAKAKAAHDQATRRTATAGSDVVATTAVADPDAGADATQDDLDGDPFGDEDVDQPDEEPVDVAGAIGLDGTVESDADPGL